MLFSQSKENRLNRSLSPSALLAFIRTAELGSFASAARHLGMSPAAVGQAVRRLEESCGVRLLTRTTRKMGLTPDGHLLLRRSRPLLAELDEVGRVFAESRGVASGPLRVSAPVGLGRRYVLPLLARFVAEHPEVSVHFDTSDAVRDLAGDPVDVAFRVWRPQDAGVVAVPISRLQAVSVASPLYLEQFGTPLHPRELTRHRCIVYQHAATGVRAPLCFRVNGREQIQEPAERFVVNDVDIACEAAVLGLGLVQPPSSYALPYLQDGRLVQVLEKFRTSPWTLYLCYSSAKRLPLRVRAFLDFARGALRGERFLV